MLTLLIVIGLLAGARVLAASAHPLPHKPFRTLDERAAFQRAAIQHHRYVCRHGRNASRRWHCKALKWTRIELFQTLGAIHQREWTVPLWPYLALAHCENRTGPELDDVNWSAYNSVYEGGYGFLHSTWRNYKPAGYPEHVVAVDDEGRVIQPVKLLATPRMQTRVAQILHERFGNYSSWPSCHVRLGLP